MCYFVGEKVPTEHMQGLLGEYELSLDAKGRLKLPSGYKKQLDAGEDSEFVLNRGFEKCLTLYTLPQWKLVENKFSQINDYNPKGRALRRMFLSGATRLSPDTAGRILLPKQMIEHAGMKKDIVFSAQMNKVEIWAADTYKEVTSFSAEDLNALASEVLGGDFLNPLDSLDK